MTYCKIQASTTLTVLNNATLLQVWKDYGPHAQPLIGRMVVETPLTDAQLRRMSSRLRAVVSA